MKNNIIKILLIIAHIIAVAAALMFLTSCGNTYVYNVELNECSCIQNKKDVLIICDLNENIIIKNAKCEKSQND